MKLLAGVAALLELGGRDGAEARHQEGAEDGGHGRALRAKKDTLVLPWASLWLMV